jgi:hypothetical protein
MDENIQIDVDEGIQLGAMMIYYHFIIFNYKNTKQYTKFNKDYTGHTIRLSFFKEIIQSSSSYPFL